MESFAERLKRYVDRPAVDTLGWMIMMFQNEYASELRPARESKLYCCVYLLAHSIIQTITELMFSRSGEAGTRFFLQHFVDGAPEDRKFSRIANEIHNVRNIIAHRAYSKAQHEIAYFRDDIPEGWRREPDGSLSINPALYSMQVELVFKGSTLYQEFCNQPPLHLLRVKYRFIRSWLELDKTDPITVAIKALDELSPGSDLSAAGDAIRLKLFERYGLS